MKDDIDILFKDPHLGRPPATGAVILYIDANEGELKRFAATFKDTYQVFLADSIQKGIGIIRQQEKEGINISVVISALPADTPQNLPLLNIDHSPWIFLQLCQATNWALPSNGQKGFGAYQYILQPWEPVPLKIAIENAQKAYQLRTENTQLVNYLKNANYELDLFLYRSAHDLRHPITNFQGLAQLGMMTTKDPDALKLFELVNTTAHRTDRMIRKLMMAGAINSLDQPFARINLREAVQKVWDKVVGETPVIIPRFDLNIPDSLHLQTESEMLEIILANVLENAIHFAKKDSPFVQVDGLEDQGRVKIRISDNGSGIDSAYQDRIFEMYYRANPDSGGNGLGLYLAKKAVNKLGGTIELEKYRDRITRFLVTLPQ